jgi:2-phospho-L-lactate guanylyltransferase
VGSQGAENVWAVVPVKHLKDAKQRLSPVLTPEQRRLLIGAMLEDVLRALCQARCLAGVMLVTGDVVAQAVAKRFGVRVLEEDHALGHTAAVTFAAEVLAAEEVTSMLSLPADLPLVTPEEIDAVVQAHGPPPSVTVAPAHDKLGSNAMLCSPPNVLPFRFGENSFKPHLARARELGIEPRVVERPGLGLDIDMPEDLVTFTARPSSTRAYDYLRRSGLLGGLEAFTGQP